MARKVIHKNRKTGEIEYAVTHIDCVVDGVSEDKLTKAISSMQEIITQLQNKVSDLESQLANKLDIEKLKTVIAEEYETVKTIPV